MVKKQKTIFVDHAARASPASALPPLTPQELHEAKREAAKELATEQAKEELKAKHKLDQLSTTSEDILFRAKAVFPFDLFPDEIIVDPHKVSVVHRMFFASERIESVAIQSVKDISVETSFFFAKLIVIPEAYSNISFYVNYLKRADALKARDIVQGLIVSDKQAISPPASQPGIPQKIEEIGKAVDE